MHITPELRETRHWMSNVIILTVSQFLVMTGFAAFAPFIPIFIKDVYNVTDVGERGLYVSIFNFAGVIAYAIFCPVWGILADRFSAKTSMLRATFLPALLFPLMAIAPNFTIFVILRFFTAACAGTTSLANTMIAKGTPNKNQGFALGTLSSGYWGGSVFGNFIGGLLAAQFGCKFVFIFCGILYAIAGIACIFLHENQTEKNHLKYREMHEYSKYKIRKQKHVYGFTLGVWMMFGLFAVYSFARTFDAPYLAMLVERCIGNVENASVKALAWTSYLSAAACIGCMLSGMLCGYIADKIAPKKIWIFSLLVTAVTTYLLICFDNLFAIIGIRTIMCIFIAGIYPFMQKILSASTPSRKRGSVFGFSSTANNIGNIAASVVSGWTIYAAKDVHVIFIVSSLLALFLIPFGLFIFKRVMNQPYFKAHAVMPGNKRT